MLLSRLGAFDARLAIRDVCEEEHSCILATWSCWWPGVNLKPAVMDDYYLKPRHGLERGHHKTITSSTGMR